MLAKRWTMHAWKRSDAGITPFGSVRHSKAPNGMMIVNIDLALLLSKIDGYPMVRSRLVAWSDWNLG
jgi:hypothetical protein